MVFSSLFFMFTFLPAALAIYFLCPRSLKNLALFITSLAFYAWGEPIYVSLLLLSATSDYVHGWLIDSHRANAKLAKTLLISSLSINLGLLAFFKYGNFILENIGIITNLQMPIIEFGLPLGISFYTFQTMSYTIDVYRGKVPVQKNYINFGAYVSLFPQLIAGPIVRYSDVCDQLENRQVTAAMFSQGVQRFIIGLGKKVLLANGIGIIFTNTQNLYMAGETLSVAALWLGAIAFSLQIFFDFSGYSDMAIGLGMMFGFKFPENFNYPFISKSLTEFWRRWHISLGSWFREYVYIPLGGNRGTLGKNIRNILAVWALTGIWHGASWNFMVWGLFFGVMLILEKYILKDTFENLPAPIAHGYTLIMVAISFVIFAFEDLHLGLGYVASMLGLLGLPFMDNFFLYNVTSFATVLVAAILASTPIAPFISSKISSQSVKQTLTFMCLAGIMYLSICYLVDSSYNPFLYFRF